MSRTKGSGADAGVRPRWAKLASQRSNVLIAALAGTEMEGLASHFLLQGSGRCDVSSTDRIFLELTSERDLLGGRGAGPGVGEPGFITSATPFRTIPMMLFSTVITTTVRRR